jgi:integrase
MDYLSAFAPHIIGLIEQKRALGYKYGSEIGILKRFDQFCHENYPTTDCLTQEIMIQWANPRPGEHPSTLQGRLSPVRELAKYMARLGLEVYIMPKGLMPRVMRYTPHIYSSNELSLIFEQTDKCHYCNQVPYRHLVMPVFFRLLYCTGMRLSEARLLRVGDVDLVGGVITITNAKLGKHRQLPISPEMLSRLIAYNKKVHILPESDDLFFPGYGGKPMTMGNVDKNFRKFLWQARISHGGRSKGPRVHDLRHTFAVHCLRRWVLAGKNINAYLPVLQAYLGHVQLSDTAYYLHLTADLFPDITKKVESVFGFVVPSFITSEDGPEGGLDSLPQSKQLHQLEPLSQEGGGLQ